MNSAIGNRLRHVARRKIGKLVHNQPAIRGRLLRLENWMEEKRHSLGEVFPAVIQPRPGRLFLSLTGHCNWRCLGCRYERDFMVGQQLPKDLVRGMLEDARDAGIYRVRLYGGEPLLHPDLPEIIADCCELGITPFVTTNATLLESKIDALCDAGLRDISVGFYGLGAGLEAYTQRPGHAARFERSIAAVRNRCGSRVSLQMNWLLRRQTCTLEALEEAFTFAQRYGAKFQVDLIHYSLPYFTSGPDDVLQFRPEDREIIGRVVDELLRLKTAYPDIVAPAPPMLKSIPDWLLHGRNMKVPCTAGEILWIGPDGTVQLCYVTFKLGNLHERRLRDMLFTNAHRAAARKAFALECPNCHCEASDRIMRHAPSRRRYEGS